MGTNECIQDTTRVISSITSCVFARVNRHQDIQDLCKYSRVSIINSLCDKYHSLQAITDIMSIKEAFGHTEGLRLAWFSDANNVLKDLCIAALKSGVSVSVLVPHGTVDADVVAAARKLVSENNTLAFEVLNSPTDALKNANVVITDNFFLWAKRAKQPPH